MGKGGGALSMWVKEFTALVFTQTIQAFIYAVVISIILFGMAPKDSATDISADDNNSALGLMSTFALLSVFKVEDMAKKIFGIRDTKARPGNAMKSIAKTAIAAKIGKRVLDNGGKVLGGIKSVNQAGKDRAKLKKRLDEDMQDNGFKLDENGNPTYIGKGASGGSGGGDFGDSDSGSSGGSGSGSSGGASPQMKASDQRRMRNALRTYEDKMSEIEKNKKAGIKNIVSGFAETAGAVVGGTTGMVLGGADGNLDEALQGIMAGAGAGDAVAQGTVNLVDRQIEFLKRNFKDSEKLSKKKLDQAINSYKEALKNSSTSYGADVDDVDD